MPVTTKLIRGRYRVVEEDTGRIATNQAGTPVDGGGFTKQDRAERQVSAINRSLALRKGGK